MKKNITSLLLMAFIFSLNICKKINPSLIFTLAVNYYFDTIAYIPQSGNLVYLLNVPLRLIPEPYFFKNGTIYLGSIYTGRIYHENAETATQSRTQHSSGVHLEKPKIII